MNTRSESIGLLPAEQFTLGLSAERRRAEDADLFRTLAMPGSPLAALRRPSPPRFDDHAGVRAAMGFLVIAICVAGLVGLVAG